MPAYPVAQVFPPVKGGGQYPNIVGGPRDALAFPDYFNIGLFDPSPVAKTYRVAVGLPVDMDAVPLRVMSALASDNIGPRFRPLERVGLWRPGPWFPSE